MADGFDFAFLPEGEIIVDKETHDIQTVKDDDLRIQLAYNRIKSVSRDWFVDEVGADLEEIVGRHCTEKTVEYGKQKILNVLIFDLLWDEKDIVVKGEIQDNTHIIYTIYLRLYSGESEESYSYEITTELDLVKGVFIRMGWRPRRGGWFKGVDYLNDYRGKHFRPHA